ncbi:MAG: hypothetical protein HFJ54_00850 [Clostridia bacterium]|nr:hypothetical protein [Clostridia bacterium]
MKKGYFIYIFIALAIGLIAFSAYYLYKHENEKIEDVANTVRETKTNEITNIRLGISNLDSLNPIVSKNQNIQDTSKIIYEPLLGLTDDYKLENLLAVEWSKAENKAYLIKLRENVKWHNGTDFNAVDVKYTIDQIKNLGSEYIYFPNVSNIESIDIVNNNLLKINLYEEEPFFEYNLTFPIICASFYGEEDITTSDKSKIPMGTGMYKIQEIDINSQLELKLNTSWWNIKKVTPKIDKINVKIYSSIAEVYNAYKLGSIDFLATTNNKAIEENIGTIGYNIKENYGRQFDYLALNCENSVLSNKEVRQAINYAINKGEIINSVYGGKYIEADYPLAYGSYLYNKSSTDYEFNQDRAKRILVDNGWEYINKYWQKKINYSTVRIKLDLLVNSSNEARVNVANIIKSNLESARNTSKFSFSER